ncbi:MAG: hypothetical protein RL701_1718, partial [Pseudomonadota bacterium]
MMREFQYRCARRSGYSKGFASSSEIGEELFMLLGRAVCRRRIWRSAAPKHGR